MPSTPQGTTLIVTENLGALLGKRLQRVQCVIPASARRLAGGSSQKILAALNGRGAGPLYCTKSVGGAAAQPVSLRVESKSIMHISPHAGVDLGTTGYVGNHTLCPAPAAHSPRVLLALDGPGHPPPRELGFPARSRSRAHISAKEASLGGAPDSNKGRKVLRARRPASVARPLLLGAGVAEARARGWWREWRTW